MPTKRYKPTSPGRRFQTVSDFSEITRKKPEKSLLDSKTRSSGRNVHGRITSRHRGGEHKRRYRVVDFRRDKDGIPANVAAIEYDPNRNARVALLNYRDGEKRYILAPVGIRVGSVIESGSGANGHLGIHDSMVGKFHIFCGKWRTIGPLDIFFEMNLPKCSIPRF